MKDTFKISLYDINNLRLINHISSIKKDGCVERKIIDHQYDKVSRIMKLKFQITTAYRTIERYKTINYVKYPIYSQWKNKYRTVNKTIKLSNQNIEDLEFNNDDLISEFAEEIILLVNDESILPSWILKKYSQLMIQHENSIYVKKRMDITNEYDSRESQYKHEINNNKSSLLILQQKIIKKEKTLKKTVLKKEKILNYKFKFTDILFLGIRSILNSKYRLSNINKKIIKFTKIISDLIKEEQDMRNNIIKTENLVTILKQECIKNCGALFNEKENRMNLINNYIQNIKLLKSEITSKEFIPIKDIASYDKENIIGCYIIRNTELEKYYVGQSKNVIKRLGQHFKGTIPKNFIFFEDYANSNLQNKDDLFEVKIIKLSTKDELDKKERELILEYEADVKGYNSTSGNI